MSQGFGEFPACLPFADTLSRTSLQELLSEAFAMACGAPGPEIVFPAGFAYRSLYAALEIPVRWKRESLFEIKALARQAR
jgi:hypothetical protein